MPRCFVIVDKNMSPSSVECLRSIQPAVGFAGHAFARRALDSYQYSDQFEIRFFDVDSVNPTNGGFVQLNRFYDLDITLRRLEIKRQGGAVGTAQLFSIAARSALSSSSTPTRMRRRSLLFLDKVGNSSSCIDVEKEMFTPSANDDPLPILTRQFNWMTRSTCISFSGSGNGREVIKINPKDAFFQRMYQGAGLCIIRLF